MKIAVTSDENGMVFQHFGKTPEFSIFDVEDGKITAMRNEPTNGTGHGALAQWLQERGINLLICGGIGNGARIALDDAGIQVLGGASGDVVQSVGSYLRGELKLNPNFTCHHHDGEHEHSCGSHHEHSCGNHCSKTSD